MAATEGFGLRRLGVQVALVAALLVLGGLASTGGWGYRWDETTSS